MPDQHRTTEILSGSGYLICDRLAVVAPARAKPLPTVRYTGR